MLGTSHIEFPDESKNECLCAASKTDRPKIKHMVHEHTPSLLEISPVRFKPIFSGPVADPKMNVLGKKN